MKKLIFCFFLFLIIQSYFAKTFEQKKQTCRDITFGTAGQPCDSGEDSKRRCKIFLTCQGGKN